MDEKSLGKRLQSARQAAGMTQQQLCQHANLSFSTLTKIERGAIKSPSIFTVQAIAGALHLSLDALLGLQVQKASKQLHKTRSGVSFVYFDVNGCLVHFFQRAFARIAYEKDVSPDAVESTFWHFNDDACRGVLSLDDFNRLSAERLGIESLDWKKYYLETIEPIAEMQHLLQWASERYRVGLLTNILPFCLPEMIKSGTLPNIEYDVLIDSSEVGAIKPESKIFQIATERAGVPGEEIMLIDDSRANLMSAEKHGWHVLWFDDARPIDAAAHVKDALEPAL